MTDKEKLDKLKAFIENKFNDEFDYDVEHYGNGNFDDSYNYGLECGENDAYGEMLSFFNRLDKESKD